MKAQPGIARRVEAGLVAVAAALLTSSCAAGQKAQTSDQLPTLDGTEASVGMIDLRGVSIAAPQAPSYLPGMDVQLNMVIINNAKKTDTLTSISTPAAGGWGSYKTQADAGAVQAAASASAPTSASPAAVTSSGSPLPAPVTSVHIEPGNRVAYGVPSATGGLLLEKLTRKLYPGMSVAVTFAFADAGSVTVQVPVQLSSSPPTSIVPNPSGGTTVPG